MAEREGRNFWVKNPLLGGFVTLSRRRSYKVVQVKSVGIGRLA